LRFIVCALMVFACCLCGCSSDKNDIYLANASLYKDTCSLCFNYVYTGKDVIETSLIYVRVDGENKHVYFDGEDYSSKDLFLLTPNTSITVFAEFPKYIFYSQRNISIEIYRTASYTDETETTIAKKTFESKSLLKDVKKYVDIEKDE